MVRLPDDQAVSEQDLLRQWKRWDSGDAQPLKYKSAIAQTFGTTTGAFFPERSRRDGRAETLQASGMDTVDIIARLRASDVDVATLDALRITADRLCCEYAYMPTDQLLVEGKAWLARVVGLQHQRVNLAQHREIIALAGKLSLLVGCVEYDSGRPRDAEATRQAALMLGEEAGEVSVQGWAHEMRAWFSLTRGDYRGVIAAAEAGLAVAPRIAEWPVSASSTRSRPAPYRTSPAGVAVSRDAVRPISASGLTGSRFSLAVTTRCPQAPHAARRGGRVTPKLDQKTDVAPPGLPDGATWWPGDFLGGQSPRPATTL